MAPPTLRVWAQGPSVRTLQQGLNTALSFLTPPLADDGIFGPKTLARVRELQSRAKLAVDGVVGPNTWNTLEMVLAGTLTLVGGALASGAQLIDENPVRNAIARVAHDEWLNYGATVHAKHGGAYDPARKLNFRRGYQRLLRYFRTSAPAPGNPNSTYFGDDGVTYLHHPGQLTPMPDWCGIFALWAVRTALVPVGTWQMGSGINGVTGFISTKTPRRGDVAFLAQPKQHHAVVHTVYQDTQGNDRIVTIDGNSAATSTITRNDHSRSYWTGFFTVGFLP
jgi:Putative peptidoglycan binding domain